MQRGDGMTQNEVIALAKHDWIRGIHPRKHISQAVRTAILAKTNGTCHVCGGKVGDKWQADHVVPHSHGGAADGANCLPICVRCNRLRWCYPPDVFQLVITLGVYAKDEIRRGTSLGRHLVELVERRSKHNEGRRVGRHGVAR